MTTSRPSLTAVGRPAAGDIDVFGISHQGSVRPTNEDHFFIGSVHKQIIAIATSVPEELLPTLTSGTRGYLFLVADGVASNRGGSIASGTALGAITHHITHLMDFYYTHDERQAGVFLEALRGSVERSHQVVLAEARRDPEHPQMATTLTMVAILWPRAYVVQVGDSRAYRLRGSRLELLTRDQTMAQEMIDAGALDANTAETSPLKHVLVSAIGAAEASPAATMTDCEWEDRLLLCTDGLTKHVSDAEIAERLGRDRSAEQIARDLVDLALERGGSDNVTVIVGRLRHKRR